MCGLSRSPRRGDQVGHTGVVQGRAELSADAYVWVLAHRKDVNGWWPQGNGPVAVADGCWSAQVNYGGPQDAGLSSNSQRWSLRRRYTKAGWGGSKTSRTPGCSRRYSCPPPPMSSVRASKRFTGRPYSGTSPIGRALPVFCSANTQDQRMTKSRALDDAAVGRSSPRTFRSPSGWHQRFNALPSLRLLDVSGKEEGKSSGAGTGLSPPGDAVASFRELCAITPTTGDFLAVAISAGD